MLEDFLKALQTEVDNHSIYVWGGSGQLCCEVSEAWIRSHEQGRQPEAAVKAWKEVENGPYRDVARCFDCSGYVSFCLMHIGALNHRTNCDGLFARCQEVYCPTDGTLLFRVSPTNKNDETHVGVYFNGKQYHSKGRAYGVVCEPYKASYWQKLAWFRALKPDEPPAPPSEKKVIVVGGSVRVRSSDSTQGKVLFTAHNEAWYKAHGQKKDSDTFPLVDVAPSGWYKIQTKFPESYITNKARYTKVEQ